MHELSIAVNLVALASEEAARAGWSRIEAVYLKVGVLSGVARDALESAFDVAAEDTVLAGARLVVEEVPVMVYCPQCEAEKALPNISTFACPACGTPTPEVRGGRELEITAFEVHENDANP